MDLKNHQLNNCVIESTDNSNGSEIMDFWRSEGIDSQLEGSSVAKPNYGIVNGVFGNYNKEFLNDRVRIFKTVEQIKAFKQNYHFTMEDFSTGRVAIRWEESKRDLITKFLREANPSNQDPSGKKKFYFSCSRNPGYFDVSDDAHMLIQRGMRIVKIEMLKGDQVKPAREEEFQTIHREGLEKLYNSSCDYWRSRIRELLSKNQFKTEIKIPDEMIEEAFDQANKEQEDLLIEFFKKPKKIFGATDLKVGEIMRITKDTHKERIGKHMLRTFNQLVMIEDPSQTWSNFSKVNGIQGEKIESGTEFKIKAK